MSDAKLERLRRNSKFLANSEEELAEINRLLAGEIALELIVEQAGWKNLVMDLDCGKLRYHRERDPFGEWSEQTDALGVFDILVCLGTGFGYQLPTLLASSAAARRIVIVESRLQPLLVFLTEFELSDVLPHNASLFFAPQPERLTDYLKKLVNRYHPTSVSFVRLASFERLNPAFSEAVVEALNVAWLKHQVFLKSMEEQHEDITRHCLENLPAALSGGLLREGSGKGLRAAIIASGPSLDLNLPLLPLLAERCQIIAVGSAVNTLRGVGVHPDLVVVTDPKPVNMLHFQGDSYDFPLAFDPVIPPYIVEKFTGEKIVCSVGHGIVELILQVLPMTRLRCWGTVTSSALALCAEAGFDEVALVGTDLSFSEEEVQHAEGYMLKSKTESDEEVLDVTGKRVRSSSIFVSYAEHLDRQIETLSRGGLRIVNCCEGGILRGGEMAILAEYLVGLERLKASKGEWRRWRDNGANPATLSRLRGSLKEQAVQVRREIDRIRGERMHLSELLSFLPAAASEGCALTELKAFERALIDRDDGLAELEGESVKEAITTYLDRLGEGLNLATGNAGAV